jgi:hypothetical protein
MTFTTEFWRDVRSLSRTLKVAAPVVTSEAVQELTSDFASLSPERRQQLQHELGILIARLIQVERKLDKCRPASLPYMTTTSHG